MIGTAEHYNPDCCCSIPSVGLLVGGPPTGDIILVDYHMDPHTAEENYYCLHHFTCGTGQAEWQAYELIMCSCPTICM